ncbi:hypothetical protein ONZ45_g13618 [Pleurotus djamor]|nr:hypothetical protein ONZ45_g13618 [Pleurotus djamor]
MPEDAEYEVLHLVHEGDIEAQELVSLGSIDGPETQEAAVYSARLHSLDHIPFGNPYRLSNTSRLPSYHTENLPSYASPQTHILPLYQH